MTYGRSRTVLLFLAVAMAALLMVAGCGSSVDTTTSSAAAGTTRSNGAETTTASQTGTSGSPAGRQFTQAELAEFDGQDGQPAYVAVDGVVYDVSDSTRWPEGTHSVCNLGAAAGKDLSEIIQQAPSSMRSLLGRMPVVGTLASGTPAD